MELGIRRHLVLGLLASALLPAGAAAEPTWSKTLAGGGGNVLDARQAADGTFLVASTTDSFGTGTGDAWIVRLDGLGDVVSEVVVGDPAAGGADGACLLPDGGAVVSGRNVRDIFFQHDGWLARVAPDGSVLWSHQFVAAPGRFFPEDCVVRADGGIVVAGQASETDSPPIDAWLVAFDADGNLEWQRRHGSGAAGESVSALGLSGDGGTILAGWTTSNGAGGTDAWIAKADAAGNLAWQRAIGGTGEDEATDVAVLADGSIAVTAVTSSFGSSGRAAWLLRLAADGTLLWSAVLFDSEWGDVNGVTETVDGDLLVVGRIDDAVSSVNELWAAKIDADSPTVLWQKSYAPDAGAWGEDVVAVDDGGFLLAGTWDWGFSSEALWVVRTDSDGNLAACGLVRETSVAPTSPRLSPVDGIAGDRPAPDSPMPFSPVGDVGGASVTTQCFDDSCGALTCGPITVEPDPACAVSEVTLTANPSGGVAPHAFAWDLDGDGMADATGNPVTVPAAVGTTTVDLVVTDSCTAPSGPQTCTATTSVTVHPDQTPTVTADGPTSFCAASGENVTLDAGVGFASHQWSRNGTPLPGETAQTLLVTESGSYAVDVVDTNGCAWTSDAVLVDAGACSGCPTLTCSGITVEPETACEGEEQTFTLEVTGGAAPLTIAWDFLDDGTRDATGNPVTTTLPPGVSTVRATATDTCGDPSNQSCEVRVDVTVHPDQTPTITADGPTSFCAAEGESVTLSAPAGHSGYQWLRDASPVAGATDPDLVVTTSGSYTVAIIDANGCAWTSDPVVVDAESCVGCAALTCEEITVEPIEACAGEAQTLTLVTTGGEAPLTVGWDLDGDTTTDTMGNPIVVMLPAGTTSIVATATDSCTSPGAQECSVGTDVVVHPDQTPTITPDGPTSFCAAEGESVTLDAGAGFASYEWLRDGALIPGETGQTLMTAASGEHAVTVVDANGCEWTSAPVSIDAEACSACPTLSCEIVVDPDPACEGETQGLRVEITGGTPPFTAAWDTDGDGVDDAFGSPASVVLPAGVNDVRVRVSDSCPTMPETCERFGDATVLPGDAPAEVSDVLAGAPPLLVIEGGARIVVESLPSGLEADVRIDAIGSWYFPTSATGSACAVAATDLGDGTMELTATIPSDSWVVVTASTPCAEGPAGADSFGLERTDAGTWESCLAP